MAAGRPRRKRRWRPQPRLHLPADRGLPAGRGVGKSIASHRHRTGIATFQLSPSGLIRGPRAGDGTVALDARVKPEHDDSADDGKQIGRAHVCTPVTNAQPVCRLLLEKKKTKTHKHSTKRERPSPAATH